jgi:hypothetical protein
MYALRVNIKGKVVPALFSTAYDAMKAYWGVEVKLHAFLTTAQDIGEWSASHPGCRCLEYLLCLNY